MRLYATIVSFASLLLVALVGCGSNAPDDKIKRKATHPVTGTLTVNGKAVAGVKITLYPVNEADRSGSFWSQGFPHATTKDDSTFEVNTYKAGDGAPAGDYLVLASLMEGDGERAKDVFNNRYMDPKKPKQKLQVKEQANTLTVTLTK